MDRNLPDTIRADSLVFPSLTEVDAISNGNAVGAFDTNATINFGQFIEFAGKNLKIDKPLQRELSLIVKQFFIWCSF